MRKTTIALLTSLLCAFAIAGIGSLLSTVARADDATDLSSADQERYPNADDSQAGGESFGEWTRYQRRLAERRAAEAAAAASAAAAAQASRDSQNRAETASATTQPSDAIAAADARAIRGTLAAAITASVTAGGFDDAVQRFTTADRLRIGEYAMRKFDDLDAQATAFRMAWKEKYGEDFSLRDSNAIYTDEFFRVTPELQESARTASEKMMPADTDVTRATADAARGADGADGEINDMSASNVANVTVARANDLPEVDVRTIREMPSGDWKIDLPNSVDGPRLHDNLLRHLTAINDAKADWPEDQRDAYRLVAHHMLMALENTPAKAAAMSE